MPHPRAQSGRRPSKRHVHSRVITRKSTLETSEWVCLGERGPYNSGMRDSRTTTCASGDLSLVCRGVGAASQPPFGLFVVLVLYLVLVVSSSALSSPILLFILLVPLDRYPAPARPPLGDPLPRPRDRLAHDALPPSPPDLALELAPPVHPPAVALARLGPHGREVRGRVGVEERDEVRRERGGGRVRRGRGGGRGWGGRGGRGGERRRRGGDGEGRGGVEGGGGECAERSRGGRGGGGRKRVGYR
ncbi:hypothetical protein DMC30DRAFT_72387 [Rhodotorula diobovata]|uniref:Uncharacterized protein n=1 Tax=Rhodotorula diobovata TaxID=5288 RepID=A0A5C5FNA1_9BASI|nr:hypothetical protein DMC30DRAFT_72387 [Rhodotorula diobovata]